MINVRECILPWNVEFYGQLMYDIEGQQWVKMTRMGSPTLGHSDVLRAKEFLPVRTLLESTKFHISFTNSASLEQGLAAERRARTFLASAHIVSV